MSSAHAVREKKEEPELNKKVFLLIVQLPELNTRPFMNYIFTGHYYFTVIFGDFLPASFYFTLNCATRLVLT